MDAVVASSTTQQATEGRKQKVSPEKTTSIKQDKVVSQQIPQQIPQQMPQQFTQPSFIPSVPDMEEQEALSQLLLAWYQAGYAAGRYASIRQRKCCNVC